MGTILGHLRSLSADVIRAAHTRLNLFTVELRQEKAWLVHQIMMGTAALFLAIFALFLGVLYLAMRLPEHERTWVFGTAALAFALLAILTLGKLLLDSRKRTGMQATLRVLEEDVRALGGKRE